MTPATLSPQQLRILVLIAEGHKAATVAHRLGLAPQTVKNHLAAAYRRLGAQNGAHAVALLYAKDANWREGTKPPD